MQSINEYWNLALPFISTDIVDVGIPAWLSAYANIPTTTLTLSSDILQQYLLQSGILFELALMSNLERYNKTPQYHTPEHQEQTNTVFQNITLPIIGDTEYYIDAKYHTEVVDLIGHYEIISFGLLAQLVSRQLHYKYKNRRSFQQLLTFLTCIGDLHYLPVDRPMVDLCRGMIQRYRIVSKLNDNNDRICDTLQTVSWMSRIMYYIDQDIKKKPTADWITVSRHKIAFAAFLVSLVYTARYAHLPELQQQAAQLVGVIEMTMK